MSPFESLPEKIEVNPKNEKVVESTLNRQGKELTTELKKPGILNGLKNMVIDAAINAIDITPIAGPATKIIGARREGIEITNTISDPTEKERRLELMAERTVIGILEGFLDSTGIGAIPLDESLTWINGAKIFFSRKESWVGNKLNTIDPLGYAARKLLKEPKVKDVIYFLITEKKPIRRTIEKAYNKVNKTIEMVKDSVGKWRMKK